MKDVIYVVNFQGCKEEYTGKTGCLVKERINNYRQHIRQSQNQQQAAEEHLSTCGDGKFFEISSKFLKKNTSLRKSYEDHSIDKIKTLLNKMT